VGFGQRVKPVVLAWLEKDPAANRIGEAAGIVEVGVLKARGKIAVTEFSDAYREAERTLHINLTRRPLGASAGNMDGASPGTYRARDCLRPRMTIAGQDVCVDDAVGANNEADKVPLSAMTLDEAAGMSD